MEKDQFGFSTKFQQFINGGKWQEVKKFLTDYVVGYYSDDEDKDLTKCYVIVYKVLKNE
jgi:hypothetical protein